MFSFLIKKTFFDMWDNFYKILFLNVGFLLILAMLFSFDFELPFIAGLIFLVLKLEVVFVYAGFVSRIMNDVSNNQELDMDRYKFHIRTSYKNSLIFGAVVSYLFISFTLAMNMYESSDTFFGLTFLAVFFWVTVGLMLLFQWFFPVDARFDTKLTDKFKKCFLLFFDNGGFSCGMFFGLVTILSLSIFTGFIVPGISVALLWLNVATRLRLYKYDYLEENPNASRRSIPWDDLLQKDRETMGRRTIKGLIFPWKE